MNLSADAQEAHDRLLMLLGHDPAHTTLAPVARQLIGERVESCRLEIGIGEDGLAELLITRLW